MRWTERRATVDALRDAHATATATLHHEKGMARDADKRAASTAEALTIAQEIATTLQHTAHARIAAVVDRCLAAIFDDPYEFRIDFVRTGKRTEARLYFVRDGHPVDPMTASGGGVVDVAAFALRVAALILSRPPRRRLMILDEPFKNLSEEYHAAARDMLLMLANDFGVQFVMVTHISELRVGKIVELER